MSKRGSKYVMLGGFYVHRRTGNVYQVAAFVKAKIGRRKWWLFGRRKWVDAVEYFPLPEQPETLQFYVRTLKDFTERFYSQQCQSPAI